MHHQHIEMMEFLIFVAAVGGFIFSIVWLVFPFVVDNRLTRILELLKQQNETLKSAADRQNETNRALQFFIDRESKQLNPTAEKYLASQSQDDSGLDWRK